MLLYLTLAYRSNVGLQSCPSILLKFKKKTSHFLIKHVTREIADVRDLAGN